MLFTVTGMAQQDYQNPPSSMSSLRSSQGKLYTFKVTGKVNGHVWGGRNNIYTDNSDLATAAVHSGYVKIGETKLLKVRIINDVKDYPSISRNGINSMKCDTWAGAYHIQSSQTMPKEEPKKSKKGTKSPVSSADVRKHATTTGGISTATVITMIKTTSSGRDIMTKRTAIGSATKTASRPSRTTAT